MVNARFSLLSSVTLVLWVGLALWVEPTWSQSPNLGSSVASGGAIQSIPLFTSTPAAGGTTNYSVPVQTLLVFTALSLLPAALLVLTSFTRIIIVFSLLRQALGLQSVPPNQVLVGISLILTFFIMRPTL